MRRSVLLALTLAGSAWAAILTFGGGVAIRTPWGRLSSRDPVRPLAMAILAGIALAFTAGLQTSTSRRPDDRRWPSLVALLIAASVLAGGLRLGTFTAGGSDPSGYVSESALWRAGQLTRPAPEWVAAAPWPEADGTAAPLGYRPGPVRHTQVPTYPAGLPLLMATAHLIAGPDAEYVVVPLAGAILVWLTFVLGTRLSTPWCGVLAAGLLASSPPFLMWLVMPMSDIPVTASWTAAVVAALSGSVFSAGAAGAAVALAVLIRPNLVPLAILVALVVWSADTRSRVRSLFVFGGIAAVGPLMVALINWSLFGSPIQSGYGNLDALFSVAFVWPNIQRYATWFASVQTVVPLLGLLAPLCQRQNARPVIVATIAVAIPVLVLALYLPYMPFDDWSYLRFLLPAYPALFAGAAVVAWNAAERWGSVRWARPVMAGAIGLLVVRELDYSNAATDLSHSEPRYRLAALAAGAHAPPRTVFISFLHSGSLRYYTGRDVLRWDLMSPRSIDTAVEYLRDRGYHLYWVGDPVERAQVGARLAGTRFLAALERATPQTVANVQLLELGPSSGT